MRLISIKLILSALIIAATMPTALSVDSYLSPNIGQLYPVDWLEGGYVTPIDRASIMDPGIAGMVRWLDSPIPTYPWYSSDLAFSRQAVPSSAFIPFTEYYSTQAMPVGGEIISNPVRLDVAVAPPSYLHYGNGQALAYNQYLYITSPQANDLWIRGKSNWTQYLVCPVGTTIDLVADVPQGGTGGFFESITNGTNSQRSGIYQFLPGYNSMKYHVGEVGRHMLYLVVDNQPSNVVIIDVFAQAPVSQVPISQPTVYPRAQTQSTQPGQLNQYTPSVSRSESEGASSPSADTSASIIYPGTSPFQAYVDGSLVGIGENGMFNFSVEGGKYHVISVWDGFWMYENNIFFQTGVPNEIYVEAV